MEIVHKFFFFSVSEKRQVMIRKFSRIYLAVFHEHGQHQNQLKKWFRSVTGSKLKRHFKDKCQKRKTI